MWFKVDDNLAFNAKVVTAGNEAIGLWVRAGSWASSQLTDGFVPTAIALAMAAPMAPAIDVPMADPMAPIRALLKAGLWVEGEGGYQFHDWSDYQPSAEEEKAKRKAKSDAGRKGAEVRWASKTDGTSDGTCHSSSHGTSDGKPMPRPVPSRPITNTSSSEEDGPQPKKKQRTKNTYTAEFEQWWAHYPNRKGSKFNASKRFADAIKLVDLDTLTEAVIRYGRTVDRRFILDAEKWLHGRRWEDAPVPALPDAPEDDNSWMGMNTGW